MKKLILSLGGVAFAAALTAAPAPRQATPAGGNLYGYLGMISDAVPAGMYELGADGYKLLWRDPLFTDRYDYAMFDDAWYSDGKVCGFSLDTYEGNYIYAEVDFETGNLLSAKYLNGLQNLFITAKLNTDDGYIYGIVSDFNSTYMAWGRATVADPAKVEILANLQYGQRCSSLCYNALDGLFYGINVQQEFVSIEPSTGEQTVISTIPNAANTDTEAITGLVYSPKDRVYFWNSNLKNWDSFIYTITPEGEFELWQTLDKEEFLYFLTTDEISHDPNQPETLTVTAADFTNGSLTGTVTLQMPSLYADGREITSPLDWTLTLNGAAYTSGTAQPGASVDVSVTVEENGTYKIGGYVALAGVESFSTSKSYYIGNDTPVATQYVDLGNKSISWEAVTAGTHGGYIDVSAMTYDVYLNGQKLGNTDATSYAYDLPLTGPIKSYTATVYAVCNGMKGAGRNSNIVAAGAAEDLPIVMLPTEEEFATLSIVDANHDGSTWQLIPTTDIWYGLQIGISTKGAVNDYVFLPRAKFEDADAVYSFSFDAMALSPFYVEYVEVVLATSPDAGSVVKTVIPRTEVTRDNVIDWTFSTIAGQFEIETPGEYYVGIHCVSSANRNGVVIRDIALTNNNITASSPGQPVNLVMEAAPQGELKVNVSFGMPTTTFAGDALAADAQLTATVTNGQYSATAQGYPGEAVSMTVDAVQGTNNVSVVITDVNGYNSVAVTNAVYCGVGIPADPANLKVEVSADMMSAVLSWDAVTTAAIEGAYVDPAKITYTVYQGVSGAGYNYWAVYKEGITATSCDIRLDDGSRMGEYYFTVAAVNNAGSTENHENYYISAYMGTPYELPFYEDFDELNVEPTLSTSPWLIYDHSGYGALFDSWWLDEVSNAFGNDHTVVCAATTMGIPNPQPNAKALMAMPRFTTLNIAEAKLYLDLLTGEGTGTLTLKAKVYGNDEEITFAVITDNEGPQAIKTIEIPFPESLLGKSWVEVNYEALLPNTGDVVAISVVEITAVDSGVEAAAGSTVSILAENGCIVFDGVEGETLSIHTVDGKTVMNSEARTSRVSYAVAPGLYVARAGNHAVKVIVK